MDVKKPDGMPGMAGKAAAAPSPVFSWGVDRLGGLPEDFMRGKNDA